MMLLQKNSERREHLLLVVGALLILVAVVANEFVVARLLAANGELRPGLERAAVRAVEVVLVAIGSAIIVFRRRAIATNLVLAVASAFVFGWLGGEILLRAAIHLGVEKVREPQLYAGWCDDDDQWKLRYRWSESSREALSESGFVFDPTFGWVAGAEAPARGEHAVLLYGDSFAYGVYPTPLDKRISAQMESLLDGPPVVNLAVSGYGFDQIYLRFRETQETYDRPAILLGLMTLNLDRSILTVRDAPKPYFTLDSEDRLKLQGVPVPRDSAAWHRDHPLEIRSFLAAFVVRRLRRAMGPGPLTEIPYRQPEKRKLNSKLLEAAVREAADHDLKMVVVIFYPAWELEIEGWREHYLKGELERLGVPYLDTKPILRAAIDQASLEDYYYPPPNNHPNVEGNRLIAEALARWLKEESGWTESPSRQSL